MTSIRPRGSARARLVLALLGALWLCTGHARGQDLSMDVNVAIDRGVTRLRALQGTDGAFALFGYSGGDVARYPMGFVALPLYTLLESGVAPDDPAVQAALARLAGMPFSKVYSVSVYVLALDALGTSIDAASEERLLAAAAWLDDHFSADEGLWAYPEGDAELSNTQYAVMALWKAELHGHETTATIWPRLVEGTLAQQNPDGGFRYRPNNHQLSSGSMTAAGLAVLYACLEHLRGHRAWTADVSAAEAGIERGWEWLERHFTVTGNPYGGSSYLRDRGTTSAYFRFGHDYYLYSLQRACVLGDRRRIRELDWYRAGARELLSRELPGGGWATLESTCFAMLFLRRATLSGQGAAVQVSASASASATASSSSRSGLPGLFWRVRTQQPGKGWQRPRFKDDRWDEARTPLSTGDATTPWPVEEQELWLRRSVHLPLPDNAPLQLWCRHDDGLTLWLDGEQIAHNPTWSGGVHKHYPIDRELLEKLDPGEHVLAAKVVNTGGPGGFDLRFSDPTARRRGPPGTGPSWDAEPSASAPLLRRWLVLGPISGADGGHLMDPDLTDVSPRPGQRDMDERWETWRGLAGVLPLPGGREAAAGLAACWLHVEERTRVVLWFGARNGVRAWLDDMPIVSDHFHRPLLVDELPVVVDLKPGGQRLLVAFEVLEDSGALTVRMSDALGEPVRGVGVSLREDGPEPDAQRVAQPEGVPLAELQAAMPASPERALTFGRADELEALAIGPVGAFGAAHVPKSQPGSGSARPHPGGRGLLMLQPASSQAPLVLNWSVSGPGRKGLVEARVSADVGALPGVTGARVRLGLFDAGGERWLAEQVVVHDGGKPSSRAWIDLTAELPDDVQWPALVRLEVADADEHAGGATVFVDEIALR